MQRSFGSDNFSGVHPKVMNALIAANVGHAHAYGNDDDTASAMLCFRRLFGEGSATFFVFNGTAANVLSLRTVLEPFSAVLCSDLAHIHIDEGGAPEAILGCKLLTVPNRKGKIERSDLEPWVGWLGNEHHAQPRVVSVSQCTELGTVYTPEELCALAEFAHKHGMYFHVDGARLANALVHLGCSARELIVDTGVDMLSFGGTKNGMMFGEAVVFPRAELAARFKYLRKNALQLASKMRFVSAQFRAMLEDDLWLENARHANAMARLLCEELSAIPGIAIVAPVQANGVFAKVPRAAIPALQEASFFYVWDEKESVVRFMLSFDIEAGDVQNFAKKVRSLLG